MVDRVIVFDVEAMRESAVYEAMVADGVASFGTVRSEIHGRFVRVQDSTSDNFPALRGALRGLKISYDFHQRKANEGQHTVWLKSRNGNAEEYENNGSATPEITPLYE